jgi:hypothetical protein
MGAGNFFLIELLRKIFRKWGGVAQKKLNLDSHKVQAGNSIPRRTRRTSALSAAPQKIQFLKKIGNRKKEL